MTDRIARSLVALVCLAELAGAQSLKAPATVVAGAKFSIETSGSGKGTLYIVGIGQVIRKEVELGSSVDIDQGQLHDAGTYVVALAGVEETAKMQVVPAPAPANVAFFAKPSRLPVDVKEGISGVAYVFDVYRNLVVKPTPVSFKLSVEGAASEERQIQSRDGVAWVKMNSATRAGLAKFEVHAGPVTANRIVQQTPGDACNIRLSVRPAKKRIDLQTEPLHDCSGNALPDGTVVGFSSAYDNMHATVDVPLKKGTAKTDVPAYHGAVISAATGVVTSGETRYEGPTQ